MKNLQDLGELEVGYKYKSSLKNRPKITNQDEAYQVVKQVFNQERLGLQEQFIVVYLNRENRVIGVMNLFTGSLISTVIDQRIIIGAGIKLMASGIIVGHNHPSGNLKPSQKDIQLTTELYSACEVMGLKLLDHFIVSPEDEYVSLMNEGILPPF